MENNEIKKETRSVKSAALEADEILRRSHEEAEKIVNAAKQQANAPKKCVPITQNANVPEEDIELFADSGMELASHGYLHAELTCLDDEGVLWEVLRDRAELEHITGESVRGFAYPQGAYNEHIANILRSAGIEYARTAEMSGSFALPHDLMQWRPTCHYALEDAMALAEKFRAAAPDSGIYMPVAEAKLFTVFGHSYELEYNKNYDKLERLADALAHMEDTWYCTFIEYSRYAHAFASLDYDLSRTHVRNGSAMSVWIFANGRVSEVPLGKVIEI